jgi:hypothetical protein
MSMLKKENSYLVKEPLCCMNNIEIHESYVWYIEKYPLWYNF